MRYFDNVRVFTATVGTGSMTLGAAYDQNFMTAAEAGAKTGDTPVYRIDDGASVGIGWGAFNLTTGLLTRNVIASKIAGVPGTGKIALSGQAVVRLVGDRQSVSHKLEALDADRVATFMDRGKALVATVPLTLFLPPAATVGDDWFCHVIAAGGAVTIDPDAAELIDGGETLVVADGLDGVIRSTGSAFVFEGLSRALQSPRALAAIKEALRLSVRAAATANVNIAAPGATIDGVAMELNQPFLVSQQDAPAQNGVRIWKGAGVPAPRAAAFNNFEAHVGTRITVQEGTINGGTVWQGTSDRDGTLDTDPITFLKSNLPAMSAYQSAELEVSANAGALTVAQNGATPLVIPMDATLGVRATGAAFRLQIVRFTNGELGVVNCSDGKKIWPLTPWALADAVAIGAGADSAGVIYTTSGHSQQEFTVAGFIEWGVNGLAVLGTWDLTNLLRKQLFGPGVPLPNQEVNAWFEFPTAHTASAATMHFDNTLPQSNHGALVMSLAVAPSSAANVLECSADLYLAKQHTSWNAGVAAMFRNADTDAIAANGMYPSSSTNWDQTIPLYTRIPAADTASLKVRMGSLPAATAWYFNGRGGNNLFGGIPLSNLRCRELMT